MKVSPVWLQLLVVIALLPLASAHRPARAQFGAATLFAADALLRDSFEDIEGRLNALIGQAAALANLAADAAARNTLLQLEAVRLELRDDMDDVMREVDIRKVDLLKTVNSRVTELEQHLVDETVRLQDTLVLDIDQNLQSLGLGASPALRRVVGATQYYRSEGEHRIELRGNFIDAAVAPLAVTVSGTALPPEEIIPTGQPHTRVLTVPAEFLASFFQDRDAARVDLGISTVIPDQERWFFQFWRPANIPFETTFPIRLLPKYPVEYELEQITTVKVVDQATILWQESETVVVPGCGVSGCHSWHPVVATIPDGGQPNREVRKCFDSLALDPSLGQFVQGDQHSPHALAPACPTPPTTDRSPATKVGEDFVLMYYHQGTHDKSRNVRYEAGYHPQRTERKTEPVALTASDPESPALPQEGGRGILMFGETYEAVLAPEAVDYTLRIRTWGGGKSTHSTGSESGDAAALVDVNFTPIGDFRRLFVSLKGI